MNEGELVALAVVKDAIRIGIGPAEFRKHGLALFSIKFVEGHIGITSIKR